MSLLIETLETRDLTPLARLFKENPAVDLDERLDGSGRTALGIAIESDDLGLASFLLRKGAKADRFICQGNPALHFAALNGRTQMVDTLLKSGKFDVNQRNAGGSTPLHLAVYKGHVKTVAKLLEHSNIKINEPDNQGNTPFQVGIEVGNARCIAELLKSKQVDEVQLAACAFTPLHWAILNRSSAEKIEELLLQGVDVNAPDRYGHTPLHLAAEMGDAEVLAALLKSAEIEVNKLSNDKKTALYLAAKYGHAQAVTMLIASAGIQSEEAKGSCLAALEVAAIHEHAAVIAELINSAKVDTYLPSQNAMKIINSAISEDKVKVVTELVKSEWIDFNGFSGPLLEFVLDNIFQKGSGQMIVEVVRSNKLGNEHLESFRFTSLHVAAITGDVKRIHELLTSDGIDPNQLDGSSHGYAALHWAARNGHVEAVEELLKHSMLEVNILSTQYFTPMNLAISKGHLKVVMALLEDDRINANKPDGWGNPVLHQATLNNDLEIVTELLKSSKVDADLANEHGYTALHLAAYHGHVKVVAKLLSSGKVSVNKRNALGETVLHLAIENDGNNSVQVVTTLLSNEDIDVNVKDKEENTILHVAARFGCSEAIDVLLRNERVGINTVNVQGNTALHCAAENDRVKAIIVLLEKGIEPSRKNKQGKTALQLALSTGKDEAASTLLKRSAVIIIDQVVDEEGNTLLHLAAAGGCVKTAKELLQREGFKDRINQANSNGDTPLHCAAENGRVQMIEVLLQKGADFDKVNNDAKTAVDVACDKRAYTTVIALLEAGVQVKTWNVSFLIDYFATFRSADKVKGCTIFQRSKDLLSLEENLRVLSGLMQEKRMRRLNNFRPEFTVSRDRLLADAFHHVKSSWDGFFKSHCFRVAFEGEDGVDAGGLTEEFISQLALELESLSGQRLDVHQSCQYGVETRFFKHNTDKKCYDINWQVKPEDLIVTLRMILLVRMYDYNVPFQLCDQSLGLLFGKGLEFLSDNDLHLILGSTIFFDPDTYDQPKNFPPGIPSIGFDESQFVEQGLDDAEMTSEEKPGKFTETFSAEFRRRIDQVRTKFMQDIHEYFWDVFPINEILDRPEKWKQVLFTSDSGMVVVDPKKFAELFECINHLGAHELTVTGICKSTSHFECFKEIVEQLVEKDQGMAVKILKFVTGANMFPVTGLANMQKLKVYVKGIGAKRWLEAHTCFRTIDVPIVDTDQELKKALLNSLAYGNEGFFIG